MSDRFQKILNSVEPGDVLLSLNKNNTVSYIIAGITESNWSHTFMYIGQENIVESSTGGVKITPLKHYAEKQYAVAVLKPVHDNGESLTKQEKNSIMKKVLSFLGKRYGYLQMAWYFILRLIGKSEDPDWQIDLQPNAMVCSEAIAEGFSEEGFPIKHGFISAGIEPVDFWQSKRFYKALILE